MESEVVNTLLVRKYNQPVPRYTSYPTVPFWNDNLGTNEWQKNFTEKFSEQNHINGISLYIHLPFCESLCTYCGCNKKITTNHSVEGEYIALIEKEWMLYRKLMKQTPVIRELHLGGGTPTFFSPGNLKKLLLFILKGSIIHPQKEFSFEGHPNNTTVEHLKLLYSLGFRRVSYGVQDNDPEVQRVINRIQPFENVKNVTETARSIGYRSVNFDLIYGLPLQTLESIEKTINEVISLRPDRIAFYSYAHVPWTSKAQRLFNESNLPAPDEKIRMYIKGKELLMKNGYVDIGMDHFALPTDDLFRAWKGGKLHRNFMGYTTQQTGMMLGLGVSSISDTGNAFAQNLKTLHDYTAAIKAGRFAVKKGYMLSKEDEAFKRYILDIACKGSTGFLPEHLPVMEEYCFPKLAELAKDGLVEYDRNGVNIIGQGQYFLRNICSVFDLYLHRSHPREHVFSKAI
jgi:oxygen-independent coproporphyrinogen III oxidase